jgi:CubicO group peptidase (beta-lactamase class C family)
MLHYIKPEEVGIPSHCLINFLNKLELYRLPMHSVLISRFSKLALNAYYAPYDVTTLHRMFSVTKSFTSIAICQLATLGKLHLHDKIIHYFPEYLCDTLHPYIAEMSIEHLLTMQTCHTSTTYKLDLTQNWVESFFTTPPSHRPGTAFNYDTSASHTLCALVEKITGTTLLDFLRDSFLNKIGFSQEAYIMKDPSGVSMGGTGLMATPLDLLLFAQLILNKGIHANESLICHDYLLAALSLQSDTLINGPTFEESHGYGYQFWKIRDNGFACYGMGGQLVICLPSYDFILVTTADTQGIAGGHQLIYNSLFDEIIPFLTSEPLPENPLDNQKLYSLVQSLSIKPVQGNLSSTLFDTLQHQTYQLDDNPSGFTHCQLHLDSENKYGELILVQKEQSYTISFGFGHMIDGLFPKYNQRSLTSAIWLQSNSLYIKSHILDESIGSLHFHLRFSANKLSIYMKKTEESYFNEFSGYLEGTHMLAKS